MKIISNLKKIFLLCFITAAIVSCNNDDSIAPQPINNSIAGIASRDPQFSILVEALSRAGLVNTLQGTGPFTVFAPTNAAFTAFLQANSITNLEAVPIPVLKEILLNHVISGSFQSTALTTGYIKTLAKGTASNTNTLSMYVNTADGVRLNGVSSVTTANILASNGVIHVVDAVIGLPTIVTHAAANPALSTLATVVTSPAQASVLAALQSAGPFTVFAPTNAAFATALGVGGFANGASDAQVTTVLLYHATAGNILSASLSNDLGPIAMSTNPVQNTTINVTGGAKVRDQAGNNCNIVVVDVQCSNGVVHAIDRVLQPVL